jgi:Uma2 family endonuclease
MEPVHTEPAKPLRMTEEEYFARELTAQVRSEYIDGAVRAMSGSTYNHSCITSNLIRLAGNALAGKPCRVLESNMMIHIPRARVDTYPDLLIVCGKPEFHPTFRHALTNPVVIFEVLSPSTEGYDRGHKFRHYKKVRSLVDYVLVSQDEMAIDHFQRTEIGRWNYADLDGAEARLALPSVGVELPLAEIYRDVDLSAGDEPQAR